MTTVFAFSSRGLLARRGLANTALSMNTNCCYKVALRKPSTCTAVRVRTTTTVAYQPAANATSGTSNPFMRAFMWYAEKLDSHPIITKGLTAGFIGAMGDVMCQVFIDKPEKEFQKEQKGEPIAGNEPALWWFEAGRTGRFFVLGVGLVGPWCHAWFGALAKWYPKLTPSSIVTRVALDQFAFTPVILTTWISSLWTLEDLMGDASAEAKASSIPARLRETLPDVVVANWMLWFPCQLVNFRLVPNKYQVLFANMVSLVWNAYLSFSTRGAPAIEVEVEAEIINNAPIQANLVQRMTGGAMKLKEKAEAANAKLE